MVDISRAQSASDILTEDSSTICDILGNKSLVSKDSVSILTHKKRREGRCIPQMLPVFRQYMNRNPAKNVDCNRSVYMYFVSL